MTNFSEKRFVDIGQTLFIEWLKTANNPMGTTEEKRRLVYNFLAMAAFEAAEEFTKVFEHQEDN